MFERPSAIRRHSSRWLLACLAAWMLPFRTFAWVYPEHRDIAVQAVEHLEPARRAVFDALWEDARSDDGNRLCLSGADSEQGLTPACIDWSALSGIAGDHTCSASEMLKTVLESDWILTIADVAAQLKEDLSRIPVAPPTNLRRGLGDLLSDPRKRLSDELNRAKRTNALRTADIRMQRADSNYATRADANLAHFMLSRPDTDLNPLRYAKIALSPGSELNAVGVYVWYHESALQKAAALADDRLPKGERRALARAALFDEAFALHFLEDTYAAGHVAGSWGDVSQRKGTHDFYNENGLEVFTWKQRDQTVVLTGDAHMRPEDRALAATAVRESLSQVLDLASGHAPDYGLPYIRIASPHPDSFDICSHQVFPDDNRRMSSAFSIYAAPLRDVLTSSPVPSLGEGLGALPRGHSEVGTFVGLAASIEERAISGGFESSQDDVGFIGGLDLGLRVGLGLEGALGDAGDGLMFMQVGLHADGASSNEFTPASDSGSTGNLAAAIPARSALSTRIRMPYYLIPGDLLLLSPMYLLNPDKYSEWAVTASNGGLLGLQQGWATRIGRFQFVLGRELGASFYGLGGDQELVAPPLHDGGAWRVVSFKTVNIDLPILEYRPFRTYSADQSSTLLFQLFAGADLPYDQEVESPAGGPPPDLDPVWSVGLRMVFDWRHY